MKDDDLVTRRDVELALLEKGQKSKRYKLGDTWELNFDEIREALSEFQAEIVRCHNCKYFMKGIPVEHMCRLHHEPSSENWFCSDGKDGRNEEQQVDDKAELIEKLERMIEWFYHRYETAYKGDREMYYEGYNTISEAIEFIRGENE